jgi:RNA-directed DNA polymerase
MNEVINLEKLYLAYFDCRKGKRETINALKFEWDVERHLFLLLDELQTRKYKPGRSICFAVKEPTPREIFAATFRDRKSQERVIDLWIPFTEVLYNCLEFH